jgi:glycosyltransferase involved in cell wall biosynthesis
MRILFYIIGNDRRSNVVTGDSIRTGGASASGTDTSAILVAEYLAKVGHEVVIACGYTSPGTNSRGVTYTNLQFDEIENREFDLLISMLWFDKYTSLPIKVTKGIIYWSHMQWMYGTREVESYAELHNLKVGLVHVSEWERFHNSGEATEMKNRNPTLVQKVIPNALLVDIIPEIENLHLPRNDHKFVFHATWARGGRVAYDAINRLDWKRKELHAYDYLMNIDINWGRQNESLTPDTTFFFNHNGSDKMSIYKDLAEASYFLYPLYTPYSDVHKDTFSCVIAEALAMGTIVLTYPLGAVPEYYQDYCVWLPFPEGIDPTALQGEPLTKDLDGKFTNVEGIVKTLNYLNDNPLLKEQYRQKGKEVISKLHPDKIGKLWEELFTEMGMA